MGCKQPMEQNSAVMESGSDYQNPIQGRNYSLVVEALHQNSRKNGHIWIKFKKKYDWVRM